MFTAERPRHHLTQAFAERVLLFYLTVTCSLFGFSETFTLTLFLTFFFACLHVWETLLVEKKWVNRSKLVHHLLRKEKILNQPKQICWSQLVSAGLPAWLGVQLGLVAKKQLEDCLKMFFLSLIAGFRGLGALKLLIGLDGWSGKTSIAS